MNVIVTTAKSKVCCTTLYCTSLHCTALHFTTLHYTTPRHTTLCYTTLHYTTLHHTTPHYTTLHYTTLHYTVLHYTTPYCTVRAWSTMVFLAAARREFLYGVQDPRLHRLLCHRNARIRIMALSMCGCV